MGQNCFQRLLADDKVAASKEIINLKRLWLNLIKPIPMIPKPRFWIYILFISNDIVSTKMYDKREDFDFKIVNFPFLDGDVPCSISYGNYISQLIRFAGA